MKKIRNQILVTFIIFTISGCVKNKDATYHNQLIVDLNNLNQDYLASYVKDIKLIKLIGINKNMFINNIDILKLYNDCIICVDREGKSVIKCNYNGNISTKINSVGKGPGEYIFLNDVIYFNNSFEVLDNQSKKIITYNYDGSFKKEKQYNSGSFYNFDKIGNQYYLFTNYIDDSQRLLHITNLGDEAITKEIEYHERFDGLVTLTPQCFSKYKDKLLLCLSKEMQIYEIDNADVNLKYKISFGAFDIPNDIYAVLSQKGGAKKRVLHQMEYFNKVEKGGYCDELQNYCENENYISFQYLKGNKTTTSLISKHTKKQINTQYLFGKFYWNNILALKGNEIYTIIYPYMLIDYFNNLRKRYKEEDIIKFSNSNRIYKTLYNLSNEVSVNDNPIILNLQFNKF